MYTAILPPGRQKAFTTSSFRMTFTSHSKTLATWGSTMRAAATSLFVTPSTMAVVGPGGARVSSDSNEV